jgi:hypothetical protein
MKGRTSGGSADPSEEVSEETSLDEGGLLILGSGDVETLL